MQRSTNKKNPENGVPPASGKGLGNNRLNYAVLISLVALLPTGPVTLGHQAKTQVRLADEGLTPERLKVYGDFLEAFSALHYKRLANQTAPFLPSDLPEGSACVNGLELEDWPQTRKVLHRFPPEIAKDKTLDLVDPNEQAKSLQAKEALLKKPGENREQAAASADTIASDFGFLALSEIVFEKKHQFAVLKYMYFCGSRCKHGGTIVMEKAGSSWTAKTRRPCTMIVN